MNQIKIVFAVCAMTFMSFSNKTTIEDTCTILHSGTFEYMADKDKVKVVIEGDSHTEYHKGGRYIIQSKLVWVSDCEYNTTLVKVTIPNCPFPIGTAMNVKVDSIEGKTIFYTATVKGQTWPGEFKKVK